MHCTLHRPYGAAVLHGRSVSSMTITEAKLSGCLSSDDVAPCTGSAARSVDRRQAHRPTQPIAWRTPQVEQAKGSLGLPVAVKVVPPLLGRRHSCS